MARSAFLGTNPEGAWITSGLSVTRERVAAKRKDQTESMWFAAAQELRREFDEQSVRISHCVVKMRSNSQIAFAYSNIDACVS
jgi:hypothetical protein